VIWPFVTYKIFPAGYLEKKELIKKNIIYNSSGRGITPAAFFYKGLNNILGTIDFL
jgi:hypothetical protein